MQLMLFTNDIALAAAAAAAGVDRLVVDLERRGKAERQHGYHLERNDHTVDDVAHLKEAAKMPVVCRVNPVYRGSRQEIEAALEAGADVLMLPMFRSVSEVDRFLDLVRGRARTNLLFETREAVDIAPVLARSHGRVIDEVYVGLNDLRLSYGLPFAYQLLADGTVDRVRESFPDTDFGFGGITVLDGGVPLPTRHIIREQARLRSTQVIVRRAFKRDIAGRDLREEVDRIKTYYAECRRRPPDVIVRDRCQMMSAVEAIVKEMPATGPSRPAGGDARRAEDGAEVATVAPHGGGPVARSGAPAGAAALITAIRQAEFSSARVTVVGYGTMGRQYVRALRALGVRRLRVCSPGVPSPAELEPDVEFTATRVEHLACQAEPDELAIVATPIAALVPAAEHLVSLGFRRLLIEKPVALASVPIARLAATLERAGVDAACGYNRVAYPSFVEARARVAGEGGITSATYALTEIVRDDWPARFPADELARWGVANSLHVIAMAHGLIGLPVEWTGHRRGALDWHPTGRVFVGAGLSASGVPFAYHADWGSKGRWSVEVHTAQASYRLCPLERLFRKSDPTGDWEEIPVPVTCPDVKAGVTEEVAAMLVPAVRAQVPLPSLGETAALTAYAERIFGYPADVL